MTEMSKRPPLPELVDQTGRVWVARDPEPGKVAVALDEVELAALADYARHRGLPADQTKFAMMREDLTWGVLPAATRFNVVLLDHEGVDLSGHPWAPVRVLPVVFIEPAAAVLLGVSELRHLADGWAEVAGAARDAEQRDEMTAFAARSVALRTAANALAPALALHEGVPPHRGLSGSA